MPLLSRIVTGRVLIALHPEKEQQLIHERNQLVGIVRLQFNAFIDVLLKTAVYWESRSDLIRKDRLPWLHPPHRVTLLPSEIAGA